MTRSRLVALAVACLVWSLAAMPEAIAQPVDPMQRYFVFKNDTPVTIYPVISAPKNANCDPGNLGVLRILVNDQTRDAGIAPGGLVKVALPKTYPCPNGGFYNASRVYIMLANPVQFDTNINPTQRTVPIPTTGPNPPPTNLCAGDNVCWVGEAPTDYVGDLPGQLLEYTIISQIGGSASPKGPNDPDGTPVIDFDVSYVDSAYLPVAMALSDGMTAYMGSALPYADFKTRLTTFLNDPRTDWSEFGVYAQRNWNKQTLFGPAQNPALSIDHIDKIPSGNVVVVSTRPESVGFSPYYLNDAAVPPSDYQFPACNDGQHNLACFQFAHLPSGNCCPSSSPVGGLVMQGCCDVKNFLLDRTLATWVKNGTDSGGNPIPIYTYSNPTFGNMVERWQQWRAGAYQCTPGAAPATPALDAVNFCATFERTINFVWDQFLARSGCSGPAGDALNQCVVAAILGYDLKSADPAKCSKCPAEPCPTECVIDIQLNQSVQALLRSVPWTPAGGAFDGPPCGGCPSTDPTACPLSCVAPPAYAANATLWHFDKFLHFWAPYESPYNLDPFARLVHVNVPANSEGLDAPGAYSFSIDDFYGNFGGVGSTLLIDVGGTSALINKSAYDPYTQYFVGVAPGWAAAEVCGRDVKLSSPASGLGTNVAFSFWAADGSGRQKTCDVTLYADAAKTEFVKFQVSEEQYGVHDNYTGQDHQVYGLGGVFAVRQGQTVPVADNTYCCQNSSPSLAGKGKCQANLTPGFLNLAYVGVTDCDDPNDSTCGRPLMTLAVPALPGGAPGSACKPIVPGSTLLVASVLPSSRAVSVGSTATFFATVLNAGTGTASDVGIALASPGSQATLIFNEVSCDTNAVTGFDDVRVSIAPGGRACFLGRLTPAAPLPPTEVAFTFAGSNAAPAQTLLGVNTLLLVAPLQTTPDVIALSATPTGDGILALPSATGSGAFSLATANVGVAGQVTVTPTTHGLIPPVELSICPSNPVTAACTAAPAASVTLPIGAGQTPTFSVFARATGPISLDPSAHRITVEVTSNGVIVGRTSVAVRTP